MALAAHHALLQGPGIWTQLEHVDVVIGFENDRVASSEALYHKIGDITEVQYNSDLDAILLDAERDRIGGVVWDGEGREQESADFERNA